MNSVREISIAGGTHKLKSFHYLLCFVTILFSSSSTFVHTYMYLQLVIFCHIKNGFTCWLLAKCERVNSSLSKRVKFYNATPKKSGMCVYLITSLQTEWKQLKNLSKRTKFHSFQGNEGGTTVILQNFTFWNITYSLIYI